MTAINVARLAIAGDGSNVVSLDQVIEAMRETAADMQVKYKETAHGGLSVNVVECRGTPRAQRTPEGRKA